MVLTARTLWNAQHVSSTHAVFSALNKGILCQAAQTGRFLEDKCEPTLCFSTRAILYLSRQQDQTTSNFHPQYRMFFTTLAQKIQSNALLERDALLQGHVGNKEQNLSYGGTSPEFGSDPFHIVLNTILLLREKWQEEKLSAIYQLVFILILFLVPIQGLLFYTFSLVTTVYNVSV